MVLEQLLACESLRIVRALDGCQGYQWLVAPDQVASVTASTVSGHLTNQRRPAPDCSVPPRAVNGTPLLAAVGVVNFETSSALVNTLD